MRGSSQFILEDTIMREGFLTLVEEQSNLDPVMYQYFNHYKNYRTIIFNQEVTENIVETVMLPLKEYEQDDSTDPVTLIISTPGGSVSDGLILCNIIDNYTKPLRIYIYGYACSMGTIILCAGNKNANVTKYCYPFSFALFHAGYSAIEGESLSVEDRIEFNKKIDNMIRDYVVANTKITEEEYAHNERRQWYLTAQEMKDKGLIDIIIGGDE